MLSGNSIFKINFDDSVKDLELKDGLILIALYFFYMAILYIFGLIMYHTDIYNKFGDWTGISSPMLYKFIFYAPMAAIEIAPIIIIIKIRKQSFRSIGLKKEKVISSIVLGIIFAMPFVTHSISNTLNHGLKISSFIDVFCKFSYFFIEIAFVEELIFRGFIQTRMLVLIKKKWLSIIIVGLMFGLMHIPFQMIKANMSLGAFISSDSSHLLFTCIIHIYLVYLYTRNNNILSSTITHALINFI